MINVTDTQTYQSEKRQDTFPIELMVCGALTSRQGVPQQIPYVSLPIRSELADRDLSQGASKRAVHKKL